MLSEDEFIQVVKNAPLVSIDIILKDHEGRVLLGFRKKEPAKDRWFVPGGRVRKNESLDDAFRRITKSELGLGYERSDARFVGVFENIFPSNFSNVGNFGTHYIVLAYEIRPKIIPELHKLPTDQHSKFQWFTNLDLVIIKGKGVSFPDTIFHPYPEIDPYIFPYFEIECLTESENEKLTENQYNILNARRDSFNSLLWSTPVISLTAQAFLFTIALNPDVSVYSRIISAFLALITAVASIHLLMKHRFYEEEHAKISHKYERNHGLAEINKQCDPKPWFQNKSSYGIWRIILSFFAFFALLIIIFTIIAEMYNISFF
jgi:colanic acid biosynthesis protein WcaH